MNESPVKYAVYAKRDGDGNRMSSFGWTGRLTFPQECASVLSGVKCQWKSGGRERYPAVVIVRDFGLAGALIFRCLDDGYDNENRPHTLKEECILLPSVFYRQNAKQIQNGQFEISKDADGNYKLRTNDCDELEQPSVIRRGEYSIYGIYGNIIIDIVNDAGRPEDHLKFSSDTKCTETRKGDSAMKKVLGAIVLAALIGNGLQLYFASKVQKENEVLKNCNAELQKKIGQAEREKRLLESNKDKLSAELANKKGEIEKLGEELRREKSEHKRLKENVGLSSDEKDKKLCELGEEKAKLEKAVRDMVKIGNDAISDGVMSWAKVKALLPVKNKNGE